MNWAFVNNSDYGQDYDVLVVGYHETGQEMPPGDSFSASFLGFYSAFTAWNPSTIVLV